MRCPKCLDQAMQLETWPGTELERCPRCQGLFLDRGELERMLKAYHASRVDSLGFAPDYETQDRVLGTCDRCRVPMDPLIGHRNIRIDRCPKCEAVFLDQGELAEMRKQ